MTVPEPADDNAGTKGLGATGAEPGNVVPIGVGRRRPVDRTALCTPEMGARWLAHIRRQLGELHEKRSDDRKRRPAAPPQQKEAT